MYVHKIKFPLEMARDAIYPRTTIPEIKSARGQIALSVPSSGTESTHLAMAIHTGSRWAISAHTLTEHC